MNKIKEGLKQLGFYSKYDELINKLGRIAKKNRHKNIKQRIIAYFNSKKAQAKLSLFKYFIKKYERFVLMGFNPSWPKKFSNNFERRASNPRIINWFGIRNYPLMDRVLFRLYRYGINKTMPAKLDNNQLGKIPTTPLEWVERLKGRTL